MPIIVGLVLAPVTSWATGLIEPGIAARGWNFFRIPEEAQPQRRPAAVREVHLQPAE
jgi:membrane glycosyltransferase